MPKVDWNAPGLYYMLKYRQVAEGKSEVEERITDPTVDVFAIPKPGYYKLWEFQIQAGNDVNLGPKSLVVQSILRSRPARRKARKCTICSCDGTDCCVVMATCYCYSRKCGWL